MRWRKTKTWAFPDRQSAVQHTQKKRPNLQVGYVKIQTDMESHEESGEESL